MADVDSPEESREPCVPRIYRFRRFGPALISGVFTAFLLFNLLPDLVFGSVSLWSLFVATLCGLFIAVFAPKAIGTQELRLDAEGLQVVRGLAITTVAWRAVAAIEWRTQRPNSRASLVGGFMRSAGVRQMLIVLTLRSSEVAEMAGPAVRIRRLVTRLGGTPSREVIVNSAELGPGVADGAFADIRHCWRASTGRS